MARLKGIPITLFTKVKVGEDPLGAPIYEDREVTVDNVLISPSSSEDIVSRMDLYGKRAVYTLAIPKGDNNIWANRKVRFFGEDFRVIGDAVQSIEKLVPLDWNKKVMVERYE